MNWRPRTWMLVFLVGLLLSLVSIGAVFVTRRHLQSQQTTQCFTPLSGDAEWEGDWELVEDGANPRQSGSAPGTDRVTIAFVGSELALRVRRGPYPSYLWVSVDGEPAPLLPRTERGAYLVLSSPDLELEAATIPVTAGLDYGLHSAEIVVGEGWNEWPLAGWCVGAGPSTRGLDRALAALAAASVICLISATGCAAWWARRAERSVWDRESRILAAGSGVLARPASILKSPVALVVVTAVFYASPWVPLTVISGAALALAILLRLDLGLALVAFTAPFYLHPRPFLGKSFALVEIATLLCVVSWGLEHARRPMSRSLAQFFRKLSPLDLGVLGLVATAAVSTLFADHGHVALRELRVVILGPALFYLMLRTSGSSERTVWRIVDAFVAGAAVVALIGLWQYVVDINIITAEEGFRRLRSVFGSPNNAALYLGRALPVMVSMAVFAENRSRRTAYGLLALPVASALILTFSRAAILLGVPVSLLTFGLLVRGRWRWMALILLLSAVGVAVPLLSTPRFAGLLDLGSGTLFFRLQLWRSSWSMFRDHLWLGVGPDNFLYHYRGRYILPAGWAEPHLSHAHNFLLSYATRLGLLGLIAWAWIQVSFWRTALKPSGNVGPDRPALALGVTASMSYVLAHGLVDASYFFVDLAFAFLLLLGLVQWAVIDDTGGQTSHS